ncbi:MAG: flagellar assembly protein A [Desulfotignum sp.]
MTEEKRNGLVFLARKCRLLTMEQEEKLMAHLHKRREKQPEYTEIDLLQETRSLSRDDIQFLLAVKDHLKMKMLDKRFGELGVANRFVRPENVRQALDLQNDLFKKTRQSKLIGDILLENKQISRADKTAILLTQDRIADEYLAEAMNDIAVTEIEKISLNMRFGAIAVKKGMITIDQLNTALKVQEQEVAAGSPRRYLGEILKKLYHISGDDLTHILKIQKEMEKKRLALETALSRYFSESSINKRLSRSFRYHFSKNKLEAHVQKIQTLHEDVNLPDFIRWLNAIGIAFGFIEEKKMQSFLTRAPEGSQICIARGIPPEKGKDEAVQYFFDTTPSAKDSPDTPKALVRKGDVLARIFPPEDGTPGKDVCGFTIAPPPASRLPLNCGQGVAKKNSTLVAEIDGEAILYKDRTLFVQPGTRTIPFRSHTGRIDTDLSDQYQDTILKVEGTIYENGRIRCRELEITGDVFGHVYAAGNIHVNGTIGREKDLQKKPARLTADGDIFANKKIVFSVIITGKGLTAPGADLVSSQVTAFQDIVVKNVISDSSGPCILQINTQAEPMETPFDEPIQNCKAALEDLEQKNALEDLDQRFAAKIAARDTYLAEHDILGFLQALLNCPQLGHIHSLRAKTKAVLHKAKSFPDLPAVPENALAHARDFLEAVYTQMQPLGTAQQLEKIEEIRQIKYGMYRAAVNASRRHNLAYEARKKAIGKEIQALAPKIRKTKKQLQSLISRRDAFLLRRDLQWPTMGTATVKVKNRIQQGTVIKGIQAALIMEKDMYGVKFSETRRTAREPAKIRIEGLYE